jgi:hypothetical protein
VPTHLYVAPREGHQWVELRHQIFKANTELAWFERYALGRTTYVPEQPRVIHPVSLRPRNHSRNDVHNR